MSKPRKTLYYLLGVRSKAGSSPQVPFDPANKWVTSPIIRNPFVFAGLRLLTALYVLISLIVFLQTNVDNGTGDAFFAYFTNLTYVGLCAYLWASGVQTAFYAIRWRRQGPAASYPLQTWPRILQALHVILYATIITFPIIVTAVYWGLLDSEGVWERPRRAWNAVSVHILNTVYTGCEILLTNSPPPPWIALPFTVILLCSYLGVAYITHATQGFYTYGFLDPATGARLAAYIVGIAVGQCVLFALMYLIAFIRERLTIKFGGVVVDDSSHFDDVDVKSKSEEA